MRRVLLGAGSASGTSDSRSGRVMDERRVRVASAAGVCKPRRACSRLGTSVCVKNMLSAWYLRQGAVSERMAAGVQVALTLACCSLAAPVHSPTSDAPAASGAAAASLAAAPSAA